MIRVLVIAFLASLSGVSTASEPPKRTCDLNGNPVELGEKVTVPIQNGFMITIVCRQPGEIEYLGDKRWSVTPQDPEWVLLTPVSEVLQGDDS